LIEELDPKVIGHERAPVEEGNQLHHCESTVSAAPERKAHYGWRESSSGRKVFIVEAFLEVVLPEQEGNDRKRAKDEECNDVCGDRQLLCRVKM